MAARAIAFLGSLLAVAATPTRAVVVLNTDFGSVVDATYANNEVIGAGGSATTQLTVKVPASGFSVKTTGGTMQFTQTVAANPSPGGVEKYFGNGPAVTQLSGSVSFKVLTSVRHDSLNFAITDGSTFGASGTTASVQVRITNDNQFCYLDGGTLKIAVAPLLTGVNYKFEFAAEYTNATQNTWSFKLIDLDATAGDGVVFNSGTINTRAPLAAAKGMVITSAQGDALADPYISISSITLDATLASVPEPATYALFVSGLVLAGVWSARRIVGRRL
ncbi:PEP-CTERM putative exosortase interaction domain-containing protein [Opitutaceae bacterium TAV1]|nr:anchor protein [Opitutaceae bacterium TAV5]EIP98652.1 PEP-CTERM putative exosortase interaction domain-containing protein [Opitutaceae bacterium TAV1]